MVKKQIDWVDVRNMFLALNCCRCRCEFTDETCKSTECYELTKTILEAIDKQIPKTPSQDSVDEILSFPTCPNCLQGLEGSEHHCGECGQAIDWSE